MPKPRIFSLSSFLFSAAAVLPSFSTAAFAALQWEQTIVECPADLKSDTVEAIFRFTNAGKETATIVDLKSSCACAVVTPAKRTLKPGESSELKVAFTLRGIPGPQLATVEVITDVAAESPVVLQVRATIPEFLTLAPRTVAWNLNETANAKESLLTPPPNSGMQVVGFRGELTVFEVTLRRDAKDGQQYLVVRPRTTAAPAHEFVLLDVQAPGGPIRTKTLALRVRPAAP